MYCLLAPGSPLIACSAIMEVSSAFLVSWEIFSFVSRGHWKWKRFLFLLILEFIKIAFIYFHHHLSSYTFSIFTSKPPPPPIPLLVMSSSYQDPLRSVGGKGECGDGSAFPTQAPVVHRGQLLSPAFHIIMMLTTHSNGFQVPSMASLSLCGCLTWHLRGQKFAHIELQQTHPPSTHLWLYLCQWGLSPGRGLLLGSSLSLDLVAAPYIWYSCVFLIIFLPFNSQRPITPIPSSR